MSTINHVAIIMDGNGRWAKARLRGRTWGHVRGVKTVNKIVSEASKIGLKSLTLYSFSTENWSRPRPEVSALFAILKKYIIRERTTILNNNIVFKILGDISVLPETTKKLIEDLERDSSANSGLKLVLAFNYGSRSEIIHKINSFTINNPGTPVDEEIFGKLISNDGVGDIDLLIRTGGDFRISNFLLWQLAYAELYFTQTMWPDFTVDEFRNILDQVSKRDRRFGMVEPSNGFEVSKRKATKNKKEYNTHQLSN